MKITGGFIMLNIVKTAEEGKVTYSLEGRLDTNTSEELETDLTETIQEAEELIMDFEKLDYISSAGLRILLAAYKAMVKKGGMKVVHVNSTIMEIFDVTGFSDILSIE